MELKNLIKEYKNAVDADLCNSIIEHFEELESEGMTRKGVVGYQREVAAHAKQTTEVYLGDTFSPVKCNKIADIILNHIPRYYLEFHEKNKKSDKWNPMAGFLNIWPMGLSRLQVQKYDFKKKEGFHQWHQEIASYAGANRVLVWTIYLNDVEEGGETDFFYIDSKIRSEKGKLAFFPPHWPYVHKGNIPLSNDKYIITGWLVWDREPPIKA